MFHAQGAEHPQIRAGPLSAARGRPLVHEPVAFPLEVEEFLTWLRVEKGRSPATLAAYRRDLAGWLRWLGARGVALADATEADVNEHVVALQGLGRSAATVKRVVVAVRSLHRFLALEGITATDPAADVEVPRVPAGLPKALTEDEVNRLLDAVVGDDPVACRDRAMLEVLYGTGLRIAELVGLSLADVDLEDAQLRAFGKGAKERIVPLGRPAVNALRAWLDPDRRGALTPERWARRTDAEAVFLNVRGGRLTPPGSLGDRAQVREPGGPGRPADAARAAPLVRHPHARPRCRHPLRPGAPGPRLGEHHADLHPGVERAAVAGVPRRPPPRPLRVAADSVWVHFSLAGGRMIDPERAVAGSAREGRLRRNRGGGSGVTVSVASTPSTPPPHRMLTG